MDDALSHCCRSAGGLRAGRVCQLEGELTWVFAAAVGGAAEPGSYDGRPECAAGHCRTAALDFDCIVRANRSRPVGDEGACECGK